MSRCKRRPGCRACVHSVSDNIRDGFLSDASPTRAQIVMKTACGTPGYVAPEVLTNQNYSSQVTRLSQTLQDAIPSDLNSSQTQSFQEEEKRQSFQNSIPPDRNPSATRCLRNSHSLRNAIPPCLCRSTCGVLVSSCTFYSVASRHFTVTTTTSSLGRSKRGTSGFVRRIGTTSRGMPRILSPGSSRLTGKGG